MQMNIPATFGPICFSGSLEDWNVYGRTTDNSSHDPSGQVNLKWTVTTETVKAWIFVRQIVYDLGVI